MLPYYKIFERNWPAMRLSQKEQLLIQMTIFNFLKNLNIKIFLFGSRTDNTKKGGDIDLLIVCTESDYDFIWDQKNILKSEIEYALDEQRIDLTLATDKKLKNDTFLRTIEKDLIQIGQV